MTAARRFAIIYLLFVGVLIIGQWLFFLISGNVPELQTAPWEIGAHISAEMLMAVTLLAGGIAMLRNLPWGEPVALTGLGMAIYSEINSPGYFAQQGIWPLVIMFGVLLIGACVCVWAILTVKMKTRLR